MDSKLCIWNKAGSRCVDLTGHTSSISCVKVSDNGKIIISGSYDKTVRAWNPTSRRELCRLQGHQGPVLDLAWHPGLAVTGGRDGLAIAWDLEAGKAITTMKGHKGHVTVVNWFSSDDTHVFLTGAQDGRVRVWDVRERKSVANIPAHVNRKGAGAVVGLEGASVGLEQPLVVSAGADATIGLLDPRSSFQVAYRFTGHKDFIYSMHVGGGLCFTGSGDGMLLAHDLQRRTLLWGLGANKAAVRCIGQTHNKLVAAGDDGNAIIYSF